VTIAALLAPEPARYRRDENNPRHPLRARKTQSCGGNSHIKKENQDVSHKIV
jgi:hypothetical protein